MFLLYLYTYFTLDLSSQHSVNGVGSLSSYINLGLLTYFHYLYLLFKEKHYFYLGYVSISSSKSFRKGSW